MVSPTSGCHVRHFAGHSCHFAGHSCHFAGPSRHFAGHLCHFAGEGQGAGWAGSMRPVTSPRAIRPPWVPGAV